MTPKIQPPVYEWMRAILSGLIKVAKTLEELKGLLLVFPLVPALLYCFGHVTNWVLVWAFHLTPIPFEQLHYILLGIVPLLSCIALACIFLAVWHFAARPYPIDSRPKSERKRSLVYGTLFLLGSLALIVFLLYKEDWRHSLMLTVLSGAVVGLLLVRLGRDSDNKRTEGSGRFLMVAGAVAGSAFFFLLLIELWFLLVTAFLPQELGGIKGRCARADLVRDQLSAANLVLLTTPEARRETGPVLQSIPLNVLYRSNDVVVIALRDQPDHMEIFLAGRAVLSYDWCSDVSQAAKPPATPRPRPSP